MARRRKPVKSVLADVGGGPLDAVVPDLFGGTQIHRATLTELDGGLLREIIREAAMRAKVGLSSILVGAVGVGKTKAAQGALVEIGEGTLAMPNHDLATAAVCHFEEELGTNVAHAEGLFRVFERTYGTAVANRYRPYVVDMRWSIDVLAAQDDREVPAAITGEGSISVVMHPHLLQPLMPSPLRPHRAPIGPVIIDEAPPWVERVTVGVNALAALVAPTDDVLRSWAKTTGLGPLADLFLGVLLAAIERRRKLRGDPFSAHERGKTFAQRVIEAARGEPAFRKLVRNAFVRADDGSPNFGHLRRPACIPSDLVERGETRWVPPDVDWVLGLLVEEVLAALDSRPRRGGAVLKSTGSGKRAIAEYVVGVPWSSRLPPGMGFVILDGSAGESAELYAKCYPNADIVRIEVIDQRQPIQVHFPTTALSRRRLLAPTDGEDSRPSSVASRKPQRVLSPRAPDALHRAVQTITESVALHIGPGVGARVLPVVPKKVRDPLEAALRVACGEARDPDEQVVEREGLLQLVEYVREVHELGLVQRFAVESYGRERGGNSYEGFEAVATLPAMPSLGDIGDEEHILGLRVTRKDGDAWMFGSLATATEQAAIVQAQGRNRTLRATGPRLALHLGRAAPRAWVQPIRLKEVNGGPVPSYARAAVAALVGLLWRRWNAVCWQMIDRLRERPELAARLGAEAGADVPRLLEAVSPHEKTLQEHVERVLKAAGWASSTLMVQLPDGGLWVVHAAGWSEAEALVAWAHQP